VIEGPGTDVCPVAEFGPFDRLADFAHALYLHGAAEEAILQCRQGVELTLAAGDESTTRYLFYVCGVALQDIGRSAEAVVEAQRLLAGVDGAGDPYWRAKGLALLAEASASLGEVTRAMDALAEGAYLVASQPSRAYNHLSASMAVAVALRAVNLFEQAEEMLLGTFRGDPEIDLSVLQELALLQLHWGAMLDLAGDWRGAHRHYERGAQLSVRMHALATQLADPVMAAMARIYEAYVWERLGEPDLAERLTLAALATHRHRAEKIESHMASLTLGRARASRGEFDQARAELATVTERAQLAGREIWAATGLSSLADVDEAELGEHPAIERWRGLARELLRRLWSDREGRFWSLRARMRVRELIDETQRMGQAVMEDPLTGLGNRRRLVEHLAANERDLSIVFVDIDHFKEVNDVFSHDVGDRVLQKLADILRRHCRADDVVIRYGGDEFIVLVGAADPTSAGTVAERILDAVRSFDWSRVADRLAVTVSIGLATSLPAAEALGAADSALYAAKRSGRDQLAVF
jgi:diguanylate cyclase